MRKRHMGNAWPHRVGNGRDWIRPTGHMARKPMDKGQTSADDRKNQGSEERKNGTGRRNPLHGCRCTDEEIIQRALNMHNTTEKVVEILADLSDQYKNDGNADENDGRGNRPLDRSLYRPFKKRRSERNRRRDEGSKPRVESEKRNRRREKHDRKSKSEKIYR
jgi:hypothetical protein